MSMIRRILEAVSPRHLQILAFYLPYERRWEFPIIPSELPELIELGVSGPFGHNSFRSSYRAPKLRRLHIAKLDLLTAAFGEGLVCITPNLTDLKVSDLTADISYGNNIPQLLRAFCERHGQHTYIPGAEIEEQLSDHFIFPDNLKQIVLSFRPYYHSFGMVSCGNSRFQDRTWHIKPFEVASLRVFAKMSEVDFDLPVVILPLPPSRPASAWIEDEATSFEAFRICWEDRSLGKEDFSWILGGTVLSYSM